MRHLGALTLSVLLCASTALAAPPKRTIEDGREAFEIALPADCKLATDGPRIDFQVFYVTCEGKTYGGIYVGNAADRSMPRSRVIATEYGWPSEIQVWSLEVGADQSRADAIAASVRARRAKVAMG